MLVNVPDLTTSPDIGAGRVALVLEYDGSQYHGWQMQKSGVPSVEGALQAAVARVADHPVDIVCAGRTDAGVHASHQVVHFETTVKRSIRSWVMGINTALPDDICVHWAGNVPDRFHARFSAVRRRYRYVIFNHPVRPALMRYHVTWNYRPLDADRMHRAAQCLVGEHDFTSFRATGCQSRSPFRFVDFLRVTRMGHYVVIDIQANAFLHHMVRNIAGTLIKVGTGQASPDWVAEVLARRDRRAGGVTAPQYGLYLADVGYPVTFPLPQSEPGPAFLSGWDLDRAGVDEH